MDIRRIDSAAEYAVTFAAASGGISGPATLARNTRRPDVDATGRSHGRALLAAGNPIEHRGFVLTVLERQPFRG